MRPSLKPLPIILMLPARRVDPDPFRSVSELKLMFNDPAEELIFAPLLRMIFFFAENVSNEFPAKVFEIPEFIAIEPVVAVSPIAFSVRVRPAPKILSMSDCAN